MKYEEYKEMHIKTNKEERKLFSLYVALRALR